MFSCPLTNPYNPIFSVSPIFSASSYVTLLFFSFTAVSGHSSTVRKAIYSNISRIRGFNHHPTLDAQHAALKYVFRYQLPNWFRNNRFRSSNLPCNPSSTVQSSINFS